MLTDPGAVPPNATPLSCIPIENGIEHSKIDDDAYLNKVVMVLHIC